VTLSRSARRTALTAAVLTAGAASALAVLPSAAADQPLRLTTMAVPDRNTDLDLGEPGPSAGDTQVFVDDVQRNHRTIGTSAGSCTILSLSDIRLVGTCSATVTLPEGSLTVQGAFDEDPQVGPTGFVWAVTGGTGRYATARGEVVGTFRPGTDIVDVEVRLR
jgi:hypothetical protein